MCKKQSNSLAPQDTISAGKLYSAYDQHLKAIEAMAKIGGVDPSEFIKNYLQSKDCAIDFLSQRAKKFGYSEKVDEKEVDAFLSGYKQYGDDSSYVNGTSLEKFITKYAIASSVSKVPNIVKDKKDVEPQVIPQPIVQKAMLTPNSLPSNIDIKIEPEITTGAPIIMFETTKKQSKQRNKNTDSRVSTVTNRQNKGTSDSTPPTSVNTSTTAKDNVVENPITASQPGNPSPATNNVSPTSNTQSAQPAKAKNEWPVGGMVLGALLANAGGLSWMIRPKFQNGLSAVYKQFTTYIKAAPLKKAGLIFGLTIAGGLCGYLVSSATNSKTTNIISQ